MNFRNDRMSKLLNSINTYETDTQRMIREMGSSFTRLSNMDRKFDYSFANKTLNGLTLDTYGLVGMNLKVHNIVNFDIRPYDFKYPFNDLFPKINLLSQHIKDIGINVDLIRYPDKKLIDPIFTIYDSFIKNVWSDDFKDENEELFSDINTEIEMSLASTGEPSSEKLDASNARNLAIWILEKLILPTLFIIVAHFVNASDTGEKLDVLNQSIIESNIKNDIVIDKEQISNEQLTQLNDTLNQLVQFMEQLNVEKSDNPNKETESP